jgi:hypothetical protein
MGVRIHKQAFAAALLAAATLTPSLAFAGWQDYAAPADIDRLVQLPQIRAAAIADAQQTHSGQGDVDALARVMDAQGRAVPARALQGRPAAAEDEWQPALCRLPVCR